jgi:hypothetical protein
VRITVRLSDIELQALAAIARKEYRDVREQARFIIVKEVKRRGLLSPDDHFQLGARAKEAPSASGL